MGTKYPFIVLYTDSFPNDAHVALEARGILKQPVPYLKPSMTTDLSQDRRLYDAWTKLVCFSLYEYEHVVLLDCDMMALHNMDELMDVELDPPEMEGNGNRVFGSTHACVCNPLNRPHYPEDWYAIFILSLVLKRPANSQKKDPSQLRMDPSA